MSSTARVMTVYGTRPEAIKVEAGLRSGNLMSPFPEEANREFTSQVATLHLSPTSRQNFLREAIDPSTMVVTGNTVIDALLHTVDRDPPITDARLSELVSRQAPLLLVILHRRENWGGAMQGVGRALRILAQSFPDVTIVLPAHHNPIVRESVLPHIDAFSNVVVTEPLTYAEFTQVMASCTVVLTDSGGVQEEAPSLGRPVLVMRDKTELPKAVDAGTVRLIGMDEQRIVDEVTRLFTDPAAYSEMANAVNPYVDGRAAARSIAAFEHLLVGGERLPDFEG